MVLSLVVILCVVRIPNIALQLTMSQHAYALEVLLPNLNEGAKVHILLFRADDTQGFRRC